MVDQNNEYDEDGYFEGGEFFPSAKFNNQNVPGNITEIGGVIVGTIVSKKIQDQTRFGSNPPELLYDKKGNVKKQMRIVLQTDYSNWAKCAKVPTTEQNGATVQTPASEDDGIRAIYSKGWMDGAIRDAIRAAGVPGLRPGGKLAVKLTELIPTDNGNPYPKYVAQYQPPADDGGYFDEPAPQAQQPAPQAQPAPQQPAPQAEPQPAAGGWGNAPSYDQPPF